MSKLEQQLSDARFGEIQIEIKEESREVIAQWMPGSGAEDFVVSANIEARKPGMVAGLCQPVEVAAAAAPAQAPAPAPAG